MSGDPFRRVLPGERVTLPAAAWNAFIDAANYVRSRRHNTESEAVDEFRQTGIVRVRNNTGFAQPRFAVLALSEPIIGPAANLQEFKSKPSFEGHTPYAPIAAGRFAVLLEPLAAGAIGRGIVAGVTPVQVTVDPAHLYDYAEMEPGNTQSLRNVPHGSARVLWVEPVGSTRRWAIVRLDGGDYQAHVMILSNAPDADGYYPGEVQRYDVTTQTWHTLYPCKVVDINQ